MLSYKLNFRGKRMIQIDKWYASSQRCHVCGYKNTEVKDLSIRQWECPSCGSEHDRDINAAINILEEGKRQITTVGHTGSNACGEGVRRNSSSRVTVQSSLKQEAPAS